MMRAIFILLAALLALFSSGGRAVALSTGDAQAQALLAKHRAFVGWQYGDGTIRTLRITGGVTDEKGAKTTAFVLLSAGLVSNDTYTLLKRDNVTESEGFTGNLFWQTDYSGFTTPVYGDYAKFLASFSVLMHEGTTELPGTLTGHKTVDGKATDVVRVTLANGDPIDLFVDPANGAYVQATIDADGPYETSYHILSYQDVLPGKKMVATYRVDDGKSIHAYTKVEPNVSVTNEELHPPAPIASWTFGGGTPFPITVTHNRLLVDATVNGVKGHFILDTGADALILDDRFADRVNAHVLKGSGIGYMLTGEVKTRLRKLTTIGFGDATLHDALAFSQDFDKDDYRGLDAKGYDGLIGFDLFAGAIVKLNVYDSTMSILDPATDLSGERGLPLTVDLSQGIPTIPMMLNKTIAVNAMLDTGSPGIVFFGPDLVTKRHLKVMGDCLNLDTLSIGPITYAGQGACEYGMAADYMLLGFDFLKHFDFVFDYPHGRMFMHPNKN